MKKQMTTMTDANGNAVPVKYVQPYDRARPRRAANPRPVREDAQDA